MSSVGRYALLEAAKWGNVVEVERLLNQGSSPEVKGRDGMRALHLACDYNRPLVVKALLRRSVKIMARDDRWRTAADLCFSHYGAPECLKLLLAAGASLRDPFWLFCRESKVQTVCRWLHNRTADINLLRLVRAAGARVDAKDKLGRNALWLASCWPEVEMTRTLLEFGAKAEVKARGGESALAASLRQINNPAKSAMCAEAAELLIGSGADIYAKTPRNYPFSSIEHALIVRFHKRTGAIDSLFTGSEAIPHSRRFIRWAVISKAVEEAREAQRGRPERDREQLAWGFLPRGEAESPTLRRRRDPTASPVEVEATRNVRLSLLREDARKRRCHLAHAYYTFKKGLGRRWETEKGTDESGE
jgi:Ankyrin repeat